MKKILLVIFAFVFAYDFLHSVPTPPDAHTQHVVDMMKKIADLKAVGYVQQADSLRNELRDYMQQQNYDSLGNLHVEIRPNNSCDVQFHMRATESIIKNYITPAGDTNSVLINWKNGLPRTGVKLDNNFSVVSQINYFDTLVNRPLRWVHITPPEIEHNLLRFRNVDCWQVKFVDISSGNVCIDTILPTSNNYFLDSLDIGSQILIGKVLNSDEPDKIINISSLSPSLYFVVITDLSKNEVIYVKTINRELTIIE